MGSEHVGPASRFAISHFLLPFFAIVTIAACESHPIPRADPAIDSLAHRFLRSISKRDLPAMRERLSREGRYVVTAEAMDSTFGYFDAGPPRSIILIDAQVADSPTPTPAVRHRLIYDLELPTAHFHYFFEATIEGGDTLVTGFRVEPK